MSLEMDKMLEREVLRWRDLEFNTLKRTVLDKYSNYTINNYKVERSDSVLGLDYFKQSDKDFKGAMLLSFISYSYHNWALDDMVDEYVVWRTFKEDIYLEKSRSVDQIDFSLKFVRERIVKDQSLYYNFSMYCLDRIYPKMKEKALKAFGEYIFEHYNQGVEEHAIECNQRRIHSEFVYESRSNCLVLLDNATQLGMITLEHPHFKYLYGIPACENEMKQYWIPLYLEMHQYRKPFYNELK